MRREAILEKALWALALAERGATLLCSLFNTLYFAHYSPSPSARRLGARVLALVNLALAVESLYLGLLPLLLGNAAPLRNLRLQAAVGGLVLGASMLMTLIVLRRLWRGHRA